MFTSNNKPLKKSVFLKYCQFMALKSDLLILALMTRKKICNSNTPLKKMHLFITAYFFNWMKRVEKYL